MFLDVFMCLLMHVWALQMSLIAGELSQRWSEKSSCVYGEKKDVYIPPELLGLIEDLSTESHNERWAFGVKYIYDSNIPVQFHLIETWCSTCWNIVDFLVFVIPVMWNLVECCDHMFIQMFVIYVIKYAGNYDTRYKNCKCCIIRWLCSCTYFSCHMWHKTQPKKNKTLYNNF